MYVLGINCPPSEHATVHPHESDCTKFYECDNGESIEKSCPPGLHFNPKLSVCDWPEQAGCE